MAPKSTHQERFTLKAIVFAALCLALAIRFGIVSAYYRVSTVALEAQAPVLRRAHDIDPQLWALVAVLAVLTFTALAWFVGPIIIARGIERAAENANETLDNLVD